MKTPLVLLALSLATTVLLGNGGGYVAGVQSTGAFQPVGIDQVEMVSEKLEIDLHIEYADIRIEYVLHNPGPKVKIEAGFPSAIGVDIVYDEKNPDKPKHARPTLQNFSLKADGKPVKVSQRSDDMKLVENGLVEGAVVTSWHSFTLDFAPGQTRRLQVSYRNPYYGEYDYVSDDERISPLSLKYLFSAAGLWKGPIRDGHVTVRAIGAPAAAVQFSHPQRYAKDGPGVWTWKFTNLEPTLEDDLTIVTRPAYFGRIVAEEVPGKPDETRMAGRYVGIGALRGDDGTFDPKASWEFHRLDYRAQASSSLPPHKELTYEPENLQDLDSNTAWIEGVPGDGLGEHITLSLPQPARVTRIGIVSGYGKSLQAYENNGRPSRLGVSVDGGPETLVEIPDEWLKNELFYFDLPGTGAPVGQIKLTLRGVYPGKKDQDTAISSIELVVPLEKAPVIQPAR